MKYLSEITSIISNLSSFGVLLIAIWALIFKRKEIFRNHLTNKQIDSLLDLRDMLNRIVYDSLNVKFWADNIKVLNRSLDDFERDQPEDYKQYKKMQYDLIWLNRMIDQKSFHLFPDEFDYNKLTEYGQYLKDQAQPYSILRLSELSQEQINEFLNKTLELTQYIESFVKKLGK